MIKIIKRRLRSKMFKYLAPVIFENGRTLIGVTPDSFKNYVGKNRKHDQVSLDPLGGINQGSTMATVSQSRISTLYCIIEGDGRELKNA